MYNLVCMLCAKGSKNYLTPTLSVILGSWEENVTKNALHCKWTFPDISLYIWGHWVYFHYDHCQITTVITSSKALGSVIHTFILYFFHFSTLWFLSRKLLTVAVTTIVCTVESGAKEDLGDRRISSIVRYTHHPARFCTFWHIAAPRHADVNTMHYAFAEK